MESKKSPQDFSQKDRAQQPGKPSLKNAAQKVGMVARLRQLGLATKGKAADLIPEARRRFLFDDTALQRGGNRKALFIAEEPPEQDINDVVDIDDRRVEEFVSQELVGKFIDSGAFKAFIFVLIIINSILIALQTNESLSVQYRYLFSIFDQIVMATFVCEILLKWYYGFWVFWKAGWNILDFVIILALLLGPQLSFLSSSRILRILRVLRAFRSLRSISALAGLSLVVQTIFQSVPDMANIVLLLVIVLLVFGVSGVTLFGKLVPSKFGDLQTAMFSQFVCVTQDGWVDIYSMFKAQGGMAYVGGTIYFFCSIMIGAFVFANLVVAVVVTNLEMAMNNLRAENAAAVDTLDPSLEHPDIDPMEEVVNVTGLETFSKDVDHETQKPLQYADLGGLSIARLNHYWLLLVALEENLAEYSQIRKDLSAIYKVVLAMNLPDDDDFSGPPRTKSRTASIAIDELKKGDILSNLMKLEEMDLVTSQGKQNMSSVLFSVGDRKQGRRLSVGIRSMSITPHV